MDSDAEDEDSNSHISEVCPPGRSGRRRLVILGAQTQEDLVDPTVLDEGLEAGSDHSSDTESIDTRSGTSDAAGEAEVVSLPEAPVPTVSVPVTDSFQWLAEVDLEVVFKQRPCLMKSVPGFMKGAYRSAMRVAFAEIDQGRVERDATRSSRGWKLFLLLPRLLLHKPPRGGLVPKRKLQDRFEVFADGDWASLLASSMVHASRAAQASSRRSRRQDTDNLESRAARAEALVHMGELSAARQALEGAAVAPGTRDTLNALQDPERRPPVLRDPIPPDILHAAPAEQFSLDFDVFTRNIRSARRGAAGGPSGMTAEHLRFILESPSETAAFFRAAQDLARAEIPQDVLVLLRIVRLTALQKPGGGVRGIVCGDIVRRLVARSVAQQIAPAVQEATSPFQYALTTKAGGECVAHAIQSLTDLDSRATVISIDGISAFDMISRAAMLDGLHQVRGGDKALPFVLVFLDR